MFVVSFFAISCGRCLSSLRHTVTSGSKVESALTFDNDNVAQCSAINVLSQLDCLTSLAIISAFQAFVSVHLFGCVTRAIIQRGLSSSTARRRFLSCGNVATQLWLVHGAIMSTALAEQHRCGRSVHSQRYRHGEGVDRASLLTRCRALLKIWLDSCLSLDLTWLCHCRLFLQYSDRVESRPSCARHASLLSWRRLVICHNMNFMFSGCYVPASMCKLTPVCILVVLFDHGIRLTEYLLESVPTTVSCRQIPEFSITSVLTEFRGKAHSWWSSRRLPTSSGVPLAPAMPASPPSRQALHIEIACDSR